ncbi:DUF6705 family protein [uncultured Chryseobacterium sp.]|jgi:hypothetical protein|uniref:DUF6705 family protein n=1 Tax=uncultured Chryseobacterium sp. TaxID=259322 RepID=UPI002628E2B2|nr:DUF6705 family protein [uncultured Chryseobacterium sp.]
MKIITKIIILIGLITIVNSCKAQILPLNTALDNIPNNAQVKDLNNELNPFIGTYKANFEGNEITLFITKEENKLEKRVNKQFYRDALVIKYIIKNVNGLVLQDTQNSSLNQLYSLGTRPYENLVILYYYGTNCGVGWGKVTLKKLNSTQLSWTYNPNSTSVRDDCPANADKTVYLPETDNLIFTKQ